MNTFEDIGIQIPKIYLPRKGTNLTKWAVIACDQFTSEPEYWHEVEKLVGNAPSTLNLVLPEVYLDKTGVEDRINIIQGQMQFYLQNKYLEPHEGFIYVERMVGSKTRRGILLCLDLERYDFSTDSTSLIRATEGTIVERLPPRMKIRTGAVLEVPHILVLIDDPERTVIEPLQKARTGLKKMYDFDLMFGSGHLTGYEVDKAMEDQVAAALRELARPEVFSAKYGFTKEKPVLLFAIGDGNHSLATAKALWDRMKPEVGLNHPARHALIELENIHDEGLVFEAIHRLLIGLRKDILSSLKTYFKNGISYTQVASTQEMIKAVNSNKALHQTLGLVGGGREFGVIEITNPTANLAVGTLQKFIDLFIKDGGADKIDYVHGEEIICKLGIRPGNAGFYLPRINKADLFKTIVLDGALPRKSFSMGEAKEKRFYMEARRIVNP